MATSEGSNNNDEIWNDRLGRVVLQPQLPVVAGEFGTWTLTYTVGSYGIDEGGTLKVFHRYASDWEAPQFSDPMATGYTTIRTSGSARLRPHYEAKGHVRPWMKSLVVDVCDGSLAPGDVVVIVFGDRSAGSAGMRAQSFVESAHEFLVAVDPTNACLVRPIPQCPCVPVIAGPPTSIVCCVPTRIAPGHAAAIRLGGRDRWGNPTALGEVVILAWEGTCAASIADSSFTGLGPGTGRIRATTPWGSALSNPVTVEPALVRHNRYWGDLHAQTGSTIGTGTEEEYFRFGRDEAWLDFMSHQGNDFQMSDTAWLRLNAITRSYQEDHRFVVFPGYEWSGNTPSGGDRNVFYLHEGLPIIRSSHWQIGEAEDSVSPAHPADVFFSRLRQLVPMEKVLVGSHVGGRYADVKAYMDAELAPLIEVVSCWGVFEWLLWDALDGGHIVAVMCNSDGHKGRPGSEGPGAGEFGIGGGLTCVIAPALTRSGIFEALKQRRCYGTTGTRIDLEFTVNGHLMGSVLEPAERLEVKAMVLGTAPVERLQLLCARRVIHEVVAPEFSTVENSERVRITWGGSRMRGRGRRAIWDGILVVQGTRIVRAETHSFDSAADGIVSNDGQTLHFRSRTTGDCDGIDLWLTRRHEGRLSFKSPQGELAVELAVLRAVPTRQELGELDLFVSIGRYPSVPQTMELSLGVTLAVTDLPGNALLVKAIQSDGHMAWSSPVYLPKRRGPHNLLTG